MGFEYETYFKHDVTEMGDALRILQKICYIVTVSIVKNRDVIRKTAFKKVMVEGQRVYSLNGKDEVAIRLQTKIRGFLDAIAQTYGDELIIVVGSNANDEDDASEVYTLKFSYTPEAVMQLVNGANVVSEVRFKDAATTKLEVMELLKNLDDFLSAMPVTPEGSSISFRATFTPWTPEDYYPAEWRPSSTLYNFSSPTEQAVISSVNTKYNRIAVSAETIHTDGSQRLLNNDESTLNESTIADEGGANVDRRASDERKRLSEEPAPTLPHGSKKRMVSPLPPSKLKKTIKCRRLDRVTPSASRAASP